MTELINNQKITPGDINRKFDNLNMIVNDNNDNGQLQYNSQP